MRGGRRGRGGRRRSGRGEGGELGDGRGCRRGLGVRWPARLVRWRGREGGTHDGGLEGESETESEDVTVVLLSERAFDAVVRMLRAYTSAPSARTTRDGLTTNTTSPASANAAQIGSIAGSSNPFPTPFVPITTPLKCFKLFTCSTASSTSLSSTPGTRGRLPNANSRFSVCATKEEESEGV